MSSTPSYFAAICAQCRQASLVPESTAEPRFCTNCGARTIRVPGNPFGKSDGPLFLALERIVFEADLSKSEAALIAGELDSVAARWEPPELVLAHISPRLDGLAAVYDAKQEYSRLLLLVDMLLTVVCARMVSERPVNRRSSRPSGLRLAAGHEVAPVALPKQKISG